MQNQLSALELDITKSVASDSFARASASIAQYIGAIEESARAEKGSDGVSKLQARADGFLEAVALLVAASRAARSSELDRLRLRCVYELRTEDEDGEGIASTA